MDYHVGRDGQQLGVYSEETLRAMLGRGELRPDDLGWREGMATWQPLGELFPGLRTLPPPPPSFSAAPPPPPPPPPSGAGAYGGSRGPVLRPTKPDNNLVPAILVTLFCCLPFGIASIIAASQVDGKYTSGDYAGAAEAAAKSKKWMWWALGIGLFFTVIYGLVVIVGAASGVR